MSSRSSRTRGCGYAAGVIPHTTPPIYPPLTPGRFAAAIQRASADLLDRPGAAPDVGKCRVGIIGLADDTGVAMNHGRPGAREGPAAFRAALARYGVAARMDEPDHGAYPHVFDAGNIVPGKTLEETHERVSLAAERLVDLGLIPVGVGGGHDLTFALVRGVIRARARLGLPALCTGLYADPHLDVRPEAGSGMPFRALVDQAGVRSLANVGAEPLVNSREHAKWFQQQGGVLLASPKHSVDWLAAARAPVFVSLDIDALDAAYAPGVSALNPCGMTPTEMAGIARAAGRSANVCCFDLMELNPLFDQDHRTARVAVYLFLSFLTGLAERIG